jgi:hypothetical protein
VPEGVGSILHFPFSPLFNHKVQFRLAKAALGEGIKKEKVCALSVTDVQSDN